MTAHYVYLVTNLINNKQYVGDRTCFCDIGNTRGIGKKRNLEQKQRYSKSKTGEKNSMYGCNREKNPRFDFTIYNFFNTVTKETFQGYKFDLAQKLGTSSSSLIRVITGKRKHYKNWICLQ